MSAEPPAAELSPLDTQRWKVPSARAAVVTPDNLGEVLAFCRLHAVRFLVARCATDDAVTASAMEREGFHLMDTLLWFSRDLRRPLPEQTGAACIRDLAAGEEPAVARVAAEAFAGYRGHYHADPRLDRRQCDAVYADWAARSCVPGDSAGTVLVASLEGEIAGFISVRLNSEREGEVPLYAVAPSLQRRRLGHALLVGALRWCRERERTSMIISTQITNLASLKLWTRLGFEPLHSYYTFHKWF